MDGEQPTPSPQPSNSSAAFAVVSLVLGITSIFTSFFLIGLIFGVIGIAFGIGHLRNQEQHRGMAWAGMATSGVGMLASIAVIVFVAAFMAMIQEAQDNEWPRWEGVIAPDISVTTLDGETVTLSDLKGKRVVLDFWATWCPPCVKEIPHFIRLTEEYPDDELVIVGLSDEDAETVQSFYEEHGINYAIAAEVSNLPPPYNEITAIPTTFFIDRNGVIQFIVEGYEDHDTLRELATSDDYSGPTLTEPRENASIFTEDTPTTDQ